MKTQNILVSSLGQIAFVDPDSFQVKDINTDRVDRCPVGSEGFTPPELIGKNLLTMTQTRYSDRFRLGVIIYLLLFSHHPFMGTWKENSGAIPRLQHNQKNFTIVISIVGAIALFYSKMLANRQQGISN